MRFHFKHWLLFQVLVLGLMTFLLKPVLFSPDVKMPEFKSTLWVMFIMSCFTTVAMVGMDLSEKEREGKVRKLDTIRANFKKQAKAVIPQSDGREVMFLDDRVLIYGTDNRYREILYINIKWFAGMMDQLGIEV